MSRHRPPVTACEHVNQPHYAYGKCRNCYTRDARREKAELHARLMARRLREYVQPPAA